MVEIYCGACCRIQIARYLFLDPPGRMAGAVNVNKILIDKILNRPCSLILNDKFRQKTHRQNCKSSLLAFFFNEKCVILFLAICINDRPCYQDFITQKPSRGGRVPEALFPCVGSSFSFYHRFSSLSSRLSMLCIFSRNFENEIKIKNKNKMKIKK